MARIFRGMQTVVAVLAGIALFIMMVLTFVDVIGRYGFNKSIFGTAEIIELLMVAVVFAGVAFISSGDQHIKVEILEPWIAKRFPNVQRWCVLIFSLIVYAALAWVLGRHAFDSFGSGKTTTVLEIPQWYMSGSAAIFSLCGVVLFAMAIFMTRGHPSKLDRDFGEHAENDTQGH